MPLTAIQPPRRSGERVHPLYRQSPQTLSVIRKFYLARDYYNVQRCLSNDGLPLAFGHVQARLSALRHDFPSHRLQRFSGLFPHAAPRGRLGFHWIGSRTALLDAIRDFTEFLPRAARAIVGDFLSRRGPDVWKFRLLGWAGSLIGGSQSDEALDGRHSPDLWG